MFVVGEDLADKQRTCDVTVAEWLHVAPGTFSTHGSACLALRLLCHGFSECLCLRFSKTRSTGGWRKNKMTRTLMLRQRAVFGGRAIRVAHIVSPWPVNSLPWGQWRFGALASSLLSVAQNRIVVVAQAAFQSFSAEANYLKSLLSDTV